MISVMGSVSNDACGVSASNFFSLGSNWKVICLCGPLANTVAAGDEYWYKDTGNELSNLTMYMDSLRVTGEK